MSSIALENELSGMKNMVIALGYGTHPEVKKIDSKLRKIIGKGNFCWDVAGMITVKVPTTKKQKILDTFPEIVEEKRYFGCNFTWMSDTYKSRFHVGWHPSNVRSYGKPKIGEENAKR